MTQINVRVDTETKEKAEEVLQDLGLSMSAAINIYLKKLSREKRIPFEVSVDPFYSEENMEYLNKKFQAYKAGKIDIIEKEIIDE